MATGLFLAGIFAATLLSAAVAAYYATGDAAYEWEMIILAVAVIGGSIVEFCATRGYSVILAGTLSLSASVFALLYTLKGLRLSQTYSYISNTPWPEIDMYKVYDVLSAEYKDDASRDAVVEYFLNMDYHTASKLWNDYVDNCNAEIQSTPRLYHWQFKNAYQPLTNA